MRFKWIFLLFLAPLFAKPCFREPWGRDADIKPLSLEGSGSSKPALAARIADSIIRFHQEIISPVDGPRSHFRPTSSRYMQLAIHRYGFLKGYLMGCDRLLRENDEEWVYRTIDVDGRRFKYDPALPDKYALTLPGVR